MRLFLALFLSGSSLLGAVKTETFPSAWLDLLHYTPSPQGWESRVDGPEFFLTPQGKSNPDAEWNAFRTQAKLDSKLRCQFPARTRLALPSLGAAPCPRLHQFRENLRADSVALVFSSYYLQSPASAFGHLLLKFHRSDRPTLLDIGVNYAANPTTSNPLVYAWKGLFGGFTGSFSVAPYFVKVAEYNDMESRDLWEYELALERSEIQFLTDHLWELGHTHLDYFYLTENCGFQLLALLKVALGKRIDLESLPSIVLPIDVVHSVVDSPGLVREVRYRPSNSKRFMASFESLSPREKEDWIAWNQYQKEPDELSTAVLDTALEFMDYQHAKSLRRSPTGEIGRRKQRLLRARSAQPASTSDVVPVETAPHLGHRPHRLGVFGAKGVGGIDFRFGLHDPLDPWKGSPHAARLEFLKGRVQMNGNGKLSPGQMVLIHVGSRAPVTAYSTPASWDIQLDWDPNLKRTVGLGGGLGLSWQWAEGAFGAGVQLRADHRWGSGPGYVPALGTRAWMQGRLLGLVAELNVEGMWSRLTPPVRVEGEIRRHFEGWSLWAKWAPSTEVSAGVHWYF